MSKKPPMPWKSRGPVFNEWWMDLRALTDALDSVQGQPWWVMDTQLKYLNLRIDTRDNGFILTDRDGTQISPLRVIEAVAKFRERFPSVGRSPAHD